MSGAGYRRGAVYWIDRTRARGGEIGKARPGVAVSNNVSNRCLTRIQTVPPTSNAGRIVPSEALAPVRGSEHKALADQITTATKERIGEYIGKLTTDDLRRVETAMRRQLGLFQR